MTQQTAWRATISFASAPTEITDDQADALRQNLPGFTIIHHDGQQIHLSMTVTASTLRKAEDEAHKAARTAYTAAFGPTPVEVGIRLLTEQDELRGLAHPDELELVGVNDIAEMASTSDNQITQQRASQIVNLAGFPNPVATPGGRKVWTRKSVDLFLEKWPRIGGWAGKHATTSNS